MENIVQKLITRFKKEEQTYSEMKQAEIENPRTTDQRRNFLKKPHWGDWDYQVLRAIRLKIRYHIQPVK